MVRAKVDDRPFLINMGMLEPDFRTIYTDDSIFPAAELFDLLDERQNLLLRDEKKESRPSMVSHFNKLSRAAARSIRYCSVEPIEMEQSDYFPMPTRKSTQQVKLDTLKL